jgi:orotidine-5'-phosphate decarboxylase
VSSATSTVVIQATRESSIASLFFLTVPRPASSFGERLAASVAARESQIVLGLDPDPMALWPGTFTSTGNSPAEQAAASVVAHCQALIDAAGPACVAVKPQLARFEVLGPSGWAALEAISAHAREADLLVIADGKRGDIDVSAGAYARALMGAVQTPFGPVRGLGVDMVTVNPLMGADAIEPFVSTAREEGAGVLALVRTSNPGAADVEDLEVLGGGRVWERIAALVNELGADGVGESGLSDVGAVVGATVPEHLARARELMPRAVFLLPGVGAQGGRVEDLAPAFAPGRAGGLIAASRSIAGAHLANGGDPSTAARAEAERLREQAWSLSGRD